MSLQLQQRVRMVQKSREHNTLRKSPARKEGKKRKITQFYTGNLLSNDTTIPSLVLDIRRIIPIEA